jgi:protein-S-isoprenylcysteine O-methyltransferase Ste14
VRSGDEVIIVSRTPRPAQRRDSAASARRDDVLAPAIDHHGPGIWTWLETVSLPPGFGRPVRIGVNLAGAAGAALFASASLQFYLGTHSLIGGAFLVEQTWFVIAFLVRRPASTVSRHLGGWLLAFGGTFAGVLFRPVGAHPHWGVAAGLGLQLAGLAVCVMSLLTLGRSFGFVAADRGLVTRGPYAVVRHPMYASYLLIQSGYLLQSISLRNVLVMVLASGCNVGRALMEERLLTGSSAYGAYRRRVRRRLVPGLW